MRAANPLQRRRRCRSAAAAALGVSAQALASSVAEPSWWPGRVAEPRPSLAADPCGARLPLDDFHGLALPAVLEEGDRVRGGAAKNSGAPPPSAEEDTGPRCGKDEARVRASGEEDHLHGCLPEGGSCGMQLPTAQLFGAHFVERAVLR